MTPETRPKAAGEPLVYLPGEAAKMLRYSQETLLALMRKHRYPYLPLVPDGKPGDRGRRWGLTMDHIRLILKDQERQLPDAQPETTEPEFSPVSPDGKRRLRKGRKTRI